MKGVALETPITKSIALETPIIPTAGTEISTMLDKDFYDMCRPALQCKSRRSESIFIPGMDVCAMFEKHMSNFCIVP